MLAREFRPDAVLLFAGDGRGEVLLGQLKQHPETRHRPVYVVGPPAGRLAALRAGAAAHLSTEDGAEAVREALEHLDALERRTVKRLALIRNGSDLDAATKALLGAGDDVDVVDVAEADAIAELPRAGRGLRGAPARRARRRGVRAARAGGRRRAAARAPADRLHARAARRAASAAGWRSSRAGSTPRRCPRPSAWSTRRRCSCTAWRRTCRPPTRKLLAQLRTADSVFHGKRILIVDDDIRNVFALTSALEMRGMKVAYAENGREGVAKLREAPDVDLVLLDVMMPEMDGYETARAIRAMSRFEHLPIISLTAKAMKGDRDKCIAAGASDYITKPVDMDTLLSLMRVWLR